MLDNALMTTPYTPPPNSANGFAHPVSRKQAEICIVGNGAIAKTAALAFSQAGQSVILLAPPTIPNIPNIPNTPAPSWDVRVYALNHTAHQLLSGLKVWGALDAARVAPIEGMEICGDAAANSSSTGKLGFDAYAAHVENLAYIVEDRNLNQALDAALKFASNVELVQGRAQAMQMDAETAQVLLEDGRVLQSHLLIGADGAQSWVRSQTDIGVDFRSYRQQGVVSNFSCEVPHHGIARQWFTGSQGILALLPLPGKQVSLVWSAPQALAEKLMQESASQLAERVSQVSGHVFGRLQPLQPEAVRAFPLSLLRPHAVTAARLALIGDAAHVVHPLAGHGMNLGFADINALITAVSEREEQRDAGDERVLARYARARKEDVLLMQIATDGLARLFELDLEPVRMVRNLGLNLLDKFPVLKRHLISHAMGK